MRNPSICAALRRYSFNVAASIKMRKSEMEVLGITRSTRRFNVAASIKMRKSCRRGVQNRELQCFNVAASIKMRKCGDHEDLMNGMFKLQCGRIYKDAEISDTPFMIPYFFRASMWPHL